MSAKRCPRAMPMETIITRFKSRNQELVKKKYKNITKVVEKKAKPITLQPIKYKETRLSKNFKKNTLKTKDFRVSEFYPDKPKRNIVNKKIELKPKHCLKLIGGTKSCNKRKLYMPQKEIKHSRPNSVSSMLSDVELVQDPELDVKDMVQLIEEGGGLDDEDFLEIFTCPSPVWWEDPPDGYTEDPICEAPKPTQRNSVKTQLQEEQIKKAEKKKPKAKEPTLSIQDTKYLDVSKLNINIENRDFNFKNKRFKLEYVLATIRNKVNGSGNISKDFNKESSCNINEKHMNANETESEIVVLDSNDNMENNKNITKSKSEENSELKLLTSETNKTIESIITNNDSDQNIKKHRPCKLDLKNNKKVKRKINEKIKLKQKVNKKSLTEKCNVKNICKNKIKIGCTNKNTINKSFEFELKNIANYVEVINQRNKIFKSKKNKRIKLKKNKTKIFKQFESETENQSTEVIKIKNDLNIANKRKKIGSTSKSAIDSKNLNDQKNIPITNTEKCSSLNESCDEDLLDLEDHEILSLENIEIPIAPNSVTNPMKNNEVPKFKTIKYHVINNSPIEIDNCKGTDSVNDTSDTLPKKRRKKFITINVGGDSSTYNSHKNDFNKRKGKCIRYSKTGKIMQGSKVKSGISNLSKVDVPSQSNSTSVRCKDVEDFNVNTTLTHDHLSKIKSADNTLINCCNEIKKNTLTVDKITKVKSSNKVSILKKKEDNDVYSSKVIENNVKKVIPNKKKSRRPSKDSVTSDNNMSVEYLELSLLDEDDQITELESPNYDYNFEKDNSAIGNIDKKLVHFESDLDITNSNINESNECDKDVAKIDKCTSKLKDNTTNSSSFENFITSNIFRSSSPCQEETITNKLIKVKKNFTEKRDIDR